MNKRETEIISYALDFPDDLDSWEYDFVNEMANRDKALTENMELKLEEIADKLGI